jgi:hypothetical protein
LQSNNNNAYKNKQQSSFNEENSHNEKKVQELKSTVDELLNEKSELMDEVRIFLLFKEKPDSILINHSFETDKLATK